MKTIREFFSWEGGLIRFLNKMGELILVNIAFVLCCLPVLTIGSSITSLYYTVIKSIRRERGNPLSEFFHSMKRTLANGCIVTAAAALVFAILYIGARQQMDAGNRHMAAVYAGLMLLGICVLVNIFPVMSRFSLSLPKLLKLSFVMGIRFLPVTIVTALGTAAVCWLLFFLLPVPCILIVPGCWCYVVTFFMERALLAYMPKPEPGEDAWYYGGDTKICTDCGKEVENEKK